MPSFSSKNSALNVNDLLRNARAQRGGVDPYYEQGGVTKYATSVGGRKRRKRTKRRNSRSSRRSRR